MSPNRNHCFQWHYNMVYGPKPRGPKGLFIWNGIWQFCHHHRSSDTAIQWCNTAYCCIYANSQATASVASISLISVHAFECLHCHSSTSTYWLSIPGPSLNPIWSGSACELLRVSLRESCYQWRSRCVFLSLYSLTTSLTHPKQFHANIPYILMPFPESCHLCSCPANVKPSAGA